MVYAWSPLLFRIQPLRNKKSNVVASTLVCNDLSCSFVTSFTQHFDILPLNFGARAERKRERERAVIYLHTLLLSWSSDTWGRNRVLHRRVRLEDYRFPQTLQRNSLIQYTIKDNLLFFFIKVWRNQKPSKSSTTHNIFCHKKLPPPPPLHLPFINRLLPR